MSTVEVKSPVFGHVGWAFPVPPIAHPQRPAPRHATKQTSPLARLCKRVFDLSLTVVGGLFLLPLLGTLCLLVKIASPGPIFYSQRRLGRDGKHFRAWKFRTMVVDADKVLDQYLLQNEALRAEWERDHKLKVDPRVTWIGSILRKTSLDELPQLWNVLQGDMSLVGPRPIVDAEVDKYGDSYGLTSRVVPGITGLWQVSGRNNTTYGRRVELDAYYARHWSLSFDLYILLRTVKTVVFREGAY